MKIGISCHPSAGGSGILATELGTALAERGHEVHFVTSEPLFRLSDFHGNIVCHHVDQVSYPVFRHNPHSLALANKISEVADENGICLWHTHYAIPYAACAILAREMLPEERRFAIVTTLHGTDITLVGSDPSYFRMTKYAMERSDAVTAVSNWLNDETQRTFQLSKPVQTIYNFLNEDRLNTAPGNHSCLADANEKIVMHISNFRPVKRVTDVVRIFKRILDEMPAKLIMVGDGPERMSAVGVARQLGITDHIKYLGTYDNIESILPFADLVLQPSEHESFGLVPLEAMAFRVPVIATASGGVTEVMQDGVTGYLCDVGDIEKMARRALEILTNSALAQQMGDAGHERATQNFSRNAIVDQYEALYQDVMKHDCLKAV